MLQKDIFSVNELLGIENLKNHTTGQTLTFLTAVIENAPNSKKISEVHVLII